MNNQARELYRNFSPYDIPEWKPGVYITEQDRMVQQFWLAELRKVKYGMEIDGVKIHPWLYFYLNFWNMYVDKLSSDGSIIRVASLPDLRDNEWMFHEGLKRAEAERKGLCMFGTRRAGKTSIIASFIAWNAVAKPGSDNVVVGGAKGDLEQIAAYADYGLLNLPEIMTYTRTGTDWDKGIEFGKRNVDFTRDVFSKITIRNVNKGKAESSQSGAGTTATALVFDEIGKYPVMTPFLAAKHALSTQYGWRTAPLLFGCISAGSRVMTRDGREVNIEDLKAEEGILGFDIEKGEVSQEPITYQQERYKKPCVRITTRTGRTLECSTDHPILTKNRERWIRVDGKRRRATEWVEAGNLKVGNNLYVYDSYPMFGEKEMWEPRLVGWLIGDGSYGFTSHQLSSADKEIHDYVSANFEYSITREHTTKDGRDYKELRIRGICGNLRNLGIYGQTKTYKTLPSNIYEYRKDDLRELLGGLFDTDGYFMFGKGSNKNISLSSISRNLLNTVQSLLQRFGIHSTVFLVPKRKTIRTDDHRRIRDVNDCYRLLISDRKSILNFYSQIKITVSKKRDALQKIYEDKLAHRSRISKYDNGRRLERVIKIEDIGEQYVYNLTAGKTHTYIANGIITHNTAGEIEKVQDAIEIFNNPDLFNMIEMDWDLLRHCEEPTWRKRKCCFFMPGQMSIDTNAGEKVRTTLAEYLGKPESEDLGKIEILVTNWREATKKQKAYFAALEAKKDKLAVAERMFLPHDPEDCFRSQEDNPFPVSMAVDTKQRLINSGELGKRVDAYLRADGVTEFQTSSKLPVETFPFPGGIANAPVLLFEDPPEWHPFNFTYAAGLDFYKTTEAISSSLGAFYIFKRNVGIKDPWANRIVASYSARPSSMERYHETCEALQEAYGCECLMEGIDIAYETYLTRKHKEFKLLASGYELAKKSISPRASSTSRFGLPATKTYHDFVFSLVVDYCNQVQATEEIVLSNGERQTKEIIGVELIPDAYLLDEMINYRPHLNTDRIVAFGHALALARFYDTMHYVPQTRRQEEDDSQSRDKRRASISAFGRSRLSPFK
jgi:intein/homing endonuclease